jgi:hypothetical protein
LFSSKIELGEVLFGSIIYMGTLPLASPQEPTLDMCLIIYPVGLRSHAAKEKLLIKSKRNKQDH